MFSAMDASCSRPHTRLEQKPFLTSIPCIPTAVESSPIAAITAQGVTPEDKSVQEILFFLRVLVRQNSVWQSSPRRGHRKFTFPLQSGNTPEKSSRPPRAIGSCPGAQTRKLPFN